VNNVAVWYSKLVHTKSCLEFSKKKKRSEIQVINAVALQHYCISVSGNCPNDLMENK
jgi:hypothetical protein